MTKSHMKKKKMLNITNYIEMEIKTTMRYQLTPVRIAIINRSTNNKCWRWCGEKAPSITFSGTLNWYNHYEKQYGGT